MPIKDPEARKEASKRWRQRVMPMGYGKWLYERRKLRFSDATRFRKAIEEALGELSNEALTSEATHVSNAISILSTALIESREAEEALGRWVPTEEL